jgi:hypothetical protein
VLGFVDQFGSPFSVVESIRAISNQCYDSGGMSREELVPCIIAVILTAVVGCGGETTGTGRHVDFGGGAVRRCSRRR